MVDSAPRRARDIARAELTAAITTTARTHLAEQGAAALSLRAVARELGMASSAIYRYFPSREALLTALIIEAYDAIGAACEAAEAECDRQDLLGRWRAIAHAARGWARANPHEYALVYGTPVPGYAAPDDTIDPATRVTMLLLRLLADIDAAASPLPLEVEVEPALDAQVTALTSGAGVGVDARRALVGVGAWTNLFGMLSFELFGQFKNVFDDADALFAHQVDLAAASLGLEV